MKKLFPLFLLLWMLNAFGQQVLTNPIIIGGQLQGSQATTPFKLSTGTALPATCIVGQTFFKSNASAGSNLYGCTATNTWTAQAGGGGGGGSPAGSTGDYQLNGGAGAFGAVTPGTGVNTAFQVNVGSAGALIVNGGALGTPSSGVGTALTALNASNLSSGTVAAARGGAGTVTGALKGSGAGVVTQAACGDLSDGSASCSTDTTNASNISAGTLAAARGGAGTINGALKGNGSGVVSQAACADLSNGAAGCAMSTTAGGDLSGTLPSPTVAKVNGVAFSASPSTNTVPVLTSTNTTTWEAVPNAALANSSLTIAGHSVALGGSQALLASDLGNGTSGTGAILLQASPTFTGTMSGGSISLSGSITAANLTPSGTLTDGDTCFKTSGVNTIECDGAVAANIVTASGTLMSGQLLSGGGTKTAGVTNLSGDVTTSGSAATTLKDSLRTHSCDIAVGDTSGSTITTAQLGPQKRICFIPYAATVVEIDVGADAGTPNIIIGVRGTNDSTVTNLLSGALATAASGAIACSNTGGTTGLNGVTTCTNTLQNTSIAAGSYIELVSGAASTAKFFTVHTTYKY